MILEADINVISNEKLISKLIHASNQWWHKIRDKIVLIYYSSLIVSIPKVFFKYSFEMDIV
jgi:hypothetical protein